MVNTQGFTYHVVLHPVMVVPNGLLIADFYLSDKECLEDAAFQLEWYDNADLGSDYQVCYFIDEEEDERVATQLRVAQVELGSIRERMGSDPRQLSSAAYGYYLAMIDYPWRALQLETDPAVTEKVAALAYADQPKLEARTLTPNGHRVFSFFQNMDAWHAYLDVVTPMFNEQSVTATAYRFVDRAHELSCDVVVDPQGEPPEPKAYWEPPGFTSPLRPPS